MQTEKIFLEALNLPPLERAALIERLIESFGSTADLYEENWANEVKERIEAYRRGEFETIPLASVVERLNR